MTYDLHDITFLTLVRIDSMIRLENLLLKIEYLQARFNCNIMVLEADSYNRGYIQKLCPDIDYIFVEDKDNVFHTTKYINLMVEKIKTPFLAISGADIIIPPLQALDAVEMLRSDKYQLTYPYDGRVLETSGILRDRFVENRDCQYLQRNASKMQLLKNSTTIKGGAIFAHKKTFIEAGMENERFYGWGAEDDELYYRWQNLGYSIYRSRGVIFHLTHPRGDNSDYTSIVHKKQAYTELKKTIISTATEIKSRIQKRYYKIND
jgi:hypothetical protein